MAGNFEIKAAPRLVNSRTAVPSEVHYRGRISDVSQRDIGGRSGETFRLDLRCPRTDTCHARRVTCHKSGRGKGLKSPRLEIDACQGSK